MTASRTKADSLGVIIGRDVIETVFEDGEVKRHQTLADVRARAAVGL